SQLVHLVTRTINDLYFVVAVREIHLAAQTVIKGFLLGVAATLAAALLPAYEATTVPPRVALIQSVLESQVRQLLPRISLFAAAFLFTGTLILVTWPRSLPATFAGIFALVIGAAFLVPSFTIVLMRTARLPL